MGEGGVERVYRGEGRHAEAGRAMRQHVEPQLRGAARQGRTYAPGEPDNGGRGRRRGPFRRRARVAEAVGKGKQKGSLENASVQKFHRPGRSAGSSQRRYRPGNPEAVSQGGGTQRSWRGTLLRLASSAGQPVRARAAAFPEGDDIGGARQLRMRQLARACGMGADGFLLQGGNRAVVRRYFSQ